jgi:hypothetical protein
MLSISLNDIFSDSSRSHQIRRETPVAIATLPVIESAWPNTWSNVRNETL